MICDVPNSLNGAHNKTDNRPFLRQSVTTNS